MDNVRFFLSELDGTEWAEIDRGNGEFTSMLKSTYDEMIAQQVEHLTEKVTDEASTL